jgi:hypothetical protein
MTKYSVKNLDTGKRKPANSFTHALSIKRANPNKNCIIVITTTKED